MGDKAYLRILGGAGCGKTTALLQHVHRFLDQGMNSSDVLVVVPSEQARQAAFRHSGDEGSTEETFEIVTIHELGIRILATQEARKVTGRNPRILNNTEELFLIDDLKTTGVRSRRLREMLKYLYRCFTELSDTEAGFLQDADELNVMGVLREQLHIRRAMLPAELSATAYRYLKEHPEALSSWQKPYILVDDYHALNKASQLLVELLASDFLLVTGNPLQPIHCSEPYPCINGIRDFADTYRDVHTIELETAHRSPQRVSAIGNALLLQENPRDSFLVGLKAGMPQGKVIQVKWQKPDDELVGIARYLKARIMAGEGCLRPDDIFIAVPNRLWGRLLRAELERRNLPVNSILNPRKLSGDPRSEEGSLAMRLFTILCLLADSEDVTSWRSWLGFGNHLTNSDLWARLCAYCKKMGQDPLGALHKNMMAEDAPSPFAQAERLVEAYRLAWKLIGRLEGKRGFDLMEALKEIFGVMPDEFHALVEPLDGVEDTVELVERAKRRLFDPCFSGGGVRLGSYEMAYCLEAKVVVLTGMVDGFIPPLDALDPIVDPGKRQRLYQEQRHLLHEALMRTSEELILSYFQNEELGRAGALKLNAKRIRVDHGIRMAVLAPSNYFNEMGSALPGAVSFL
jgi:superfamily I DNA/RNA helicase